MRKLLRFRVRTVLMLVAAIALLLTASPWLWWRYNVHSALEATLADGPDVFWEVNPLQSGTSDEYAYLQSDHDRVSARLIEIAESDERIDRRINAVKTMRALAALSGSHENRKRLLPQLIELACDSQTPPSLISETAETIADWIPSTGVTAEERGHMRARAISAGGQERIAWIHVLDAIGGREEILLMIEYGDSIEPDQFGAVWNSHFRGVKWSGLLPHIDRWIQNPAIADHALDFSVLSHTSNGRSVLLDFVSVPTQPQSSRTKAVEQLAETLAGIDLLTSACTDQGFADDLSDLLDRDSLTYLAAERTTIFSRNGDDLWNQLIDGLDPNYWLPASLPTARNPLPPEVEAQYAKLCDRYAQSSLACLRHLSNSPELTTQSEWRDWLEVESPDVVPLSDLLSTVVDHPELLENSTVLRRLVPYHLGSIPDDCIPIYEQMLRSENVTMQYWACQALLAFSDSEEAIDVAIDLIDQSKPSDSASSHPGAIAMLQRRFAVNFFWDTDAWRNWANDPVIGPANNAQATESGIPAGSP